ncbi:hypothetical protein EDD18DRAFT_1103553 [Armillaria luteobubalina]|uniref:Uncharacterized protein n=1 Tax=Armillaria luteobubalina TaxID=153913 RepID=A0AA39QC19_9AGAR|nr:hypothetical protein EDD18DRAFT_1103553 [Armillaria luteobubalina]
MLPLRMERSALYLWANIIFEEQAPNPREESRVEIAIERLHSHALQWSRHRSKGYDQSGVALLKEKTKTSGQKVEIILNRRVMDHLLLSHLVLWQSKSVDTVSKVLLEELSTIDPDHIIIGGRMAGSKIPDYLTEDFDIGVMAQQTLL